MPCRWNGRAAAQLAAAAPVDKPVDDTAAAKHAPAADAPADKAESDAKAEASPPLPEGDRRHSGNRRRQARQGSKRTSRRIIAVCRPSGSGSTKSSPSCGKVRGRQHYGADHARRHAATVLHLLSRRISKSWRTGDPRRARGLHPLPRPTRSSIAWGWRAGWSMPKIR